MTGGKQKEHSTGAVKSLMEAIIISRPEGSRKGNIMRTQGAVVLSNQSIRKEL